MQDCKNKNRLVVPIEHPVFKKGHRPINSKLSDWEVLEIKQRIDSGEKLITIASNLNVSYQTVRDINTKRSYINL